MLILVKLDVIINGFRNFALSMKIVNTFLTGLLFVCFALVFSSCDDEETYGDYQQLYCGRYMCYRGDDR